MRATRRQPRWIGIENPKIHYMSTILKIYVCYFSEFHQLCACSGCKSSSDGSMFGRGDAPVNGAQYKIGEYIHTHAYPAMEWTKKILEYICNISAAIDINRIVACVAYVSSHALNAIRSGVPRKQTFCVLRMERCTRAASPHLLSHFVKTYYMT